MKRLALLLSSGLILQGCAAFNSHVDDAFAAQVEKDLVLVKGGSFVMGSSCENAALTAAECPPHEVKVDDFYIGKYEVTQGLFNQVLGTNISYFQGDDKPINNISWQQVHFFIEKLNEKTGLTFRLPTEAEWEFAARGGNLTKGYLFSGSDNIDDVAWYAGNANNKARSVGLKQPK